MAADRRYKEVVPEPIRRFEAEHFDRPSDWYIRPAANVGIYLEELEKELPSSLLDGQRAEQVIKDLKSHVEQQHEHPTRQTKGRRAGGRKSRAKGKGARAKAKSSRKARPSGP